MEIEFDFDRQIQQAKQEHHRREVTKVIPSRQHE
jgi:hypothetical protein